MKKLLSLLVLFIAVFALAGCEFEDHDGNSSSEGEGTQQDINNQFEVQDRLSEHQPTPTDFEYSIERYNLIKRAYWINGQRDRSAAEVYPGGDLPLGFLIVYHMTGEIEGVYLIDGKVSSLNSYLTKDEHCDDEYFRDADKGNYEDGGWYIVCRTLADVDGSYGENDAGIFFFDSYGTYHETTNKYHYTDYVPWNIINNLPLTAFNRVNLDFVREDGTLIQPGDSDYPIGDSE